MQSWDSSEVLKKRCRCEIIFSEVVNEPWEKMSTRQKRSLGNTLGKRSCQSSKEQCSIATKAKWEEILGWPVWNVALKKEKNNYILQKNLFCVCLWCVCKMLFLGKKVNWIKSLFDQVFATDWASKACCCVSLVGVSFTLS